ncbi:class I SAM-dependent methyltransferase [bacterium]|nr:class I SAM-dependent methyltransferase [bacterium]
MAESRPANHRLGEVADLFSQPDILEEMQARMGLGLRAWEEAVIAAHFPPTGRLLDVGCGPGREAIALAQRGYEVVAVDVSAAELERARSNAAAAGVTLELVLVDGLKMPAGPYDVAVLWVQVLGNMHSYEDQLALLESCYGVLKPGGIISASGHNREFCQAEWHSQMEGDWFYPWGLGGFRYATFTPETLERPVRAAGFEVIHTEVPASLAAIMHTIGRRSDEAHA